MFLIDTSVWIDYFREKNTSEVRFFNKILDAKLPYGITSVIYQEILQGVASKKDFNNLSGHLETQRFFHPKDPILTYKKAAELYFKCRNKGITIRSTIDCLIAEIAVEHELSLLHHDKDYLQIQKLEPRLQLVRVS